MRIAIAQICSSTDKSRNLEKVIDYMYTASKNDSALIAFPEFTMAYSPVEQGVDELYQIAESIDGEFITRVRAKAKEYSISTLVTIYERGHISNSDSKRVYDTAVLVTSDGSISSIYRKLHLYDALGFKESDKLLSGDEISIPISMNDTSIGLMICYDVRFPEMARILALLGSQILLVPSAWVKGEMKLEHWRTMLTARAIENGCYVIAPDQVGNIYIGHSMSIDPFGRVLLDMDEQEGIGYVDVDPRKVAEVRSRLPLLMNRRTDVYSRFVNTLIRDEK